MSTEPAAIDSFSGEYRWLSNFYIEPDGTHVEGEYQQAKCRDSEERAAFVGLPPWRAKKLGKRVALRADWEQVKYHVMEVLVWRKFADHAELREKLLATGGARLVEGNYWGDQVWGQCRGKGTNWLGEILMTVRKELWEEGRDETL